MRCPSGRTRVALLVEAGAPDGVDARTGELCGVSELEEAVAWITAALRDVRNARRGLLGAPSWRRAMTASVRGVASK